MAKKVKRQAVSATFRKGYDAFVNPLTKALGKEGAWMNYRNQFEYTFRTIEVVWKQGWDRAEELRATKPYKVK